MKALRSHLDPAIAPSSLISTLYSYDPFLAALALFVVPVILYVSIMSWRAVALSRMAAAAAHHFNVCKVKWLHSRGELAAAEIHLRWYNIARKTAFLAAQATYYHKVAMNQIGQIPLLIKDISDQLSPRVASEGVAAGLSDTAPAVLETVVELSAEALSGRISPVSISELAASSAETVASLPYFIDTPQALRRYRAVKELLMNVLEVTPEVASEIAYEVVTKATPPLTVEVSDKVVIEAVAKVLNKSRPEVVENVSVTASQWRSYPFPQLAFLAFIGILLGRYFSLFDKKL